MSTRLATLAALAFVPIAASIVQAQVPPPPPGAAPPALGMPNAAPVASGRIKQFIINPNGDIDGFLLVDGAQVNFPPHLSTSLLQIVRAGDEVNIQGVRGADGNVIHATVITNRTTQRAVTDQPPSPNQPPPAPPALTSLNAEGRVVQLLHADMGELNGAILEDGTIVRWPPPFGAQLRPTLTLSSSLKASGFGSQNAYGKAFEATSLAVNGQAPVAVYGPGPAPGRAPAPPAGPGAPPPAP